MKDSGRNQFNKFKGILLYLAKIIGILPLNMRKYLLRIFRKKKGRSGIAIRYIFLKAIAKDCGDNVSIHEDVYLLNPENIQIGDNVSIHPLCYIDASGGITIGNNVSLAHNVTIMSTTHTYHQKDIPIKYQPIVRKKTELHDNLWLGAKSVILAGVIIHSGSIIGASSVVTKSISKDSISVGIPARKIKERI